MPGSTRIDFVTLFPELLQLVDQGAAADPEGFGSFGPVEIVFTQGLEDRLPFDFTQSLRIRSFRDGFGGCGSADF